MAPPRHGCCRRYVVPTLSALVGSALTFGLSSPSPQHGPLFQTRLCAPCEHGLDVVALPLAPPGRHLAWLRKIRTTMSVGPRSLPSRQAEAAASARLNKVAKFTTMLSGMQGEQEGGDLPGEDLSSAPEGHRLRGLIEGDVPYSLRAGNSFKQEAGPGLVRLKSLGHGSSPRGSVHQIQAEDDEKNNGDGMIFDQKEEMSSQIVDEVPRGGQSRDRGGSIRGQHLGMDISGPVAHSSRPPVVGALSDEIFHFATHSPYTHHLRERGDQAGCKYRKCLGMLCKEHNCRQTVTAILQDLVYGSNHPHVQYPKYPLHIAKKSDVQMLYLTAGEVKRFFADDLYPRTGFLKVDEYCQMPEYTPDQLKWVHVYIIERHHDQCFILQSTYRQYSVGQWLRKDEEVRDHWGVYPDSTYNDINEMKKALGLFAHDKPEGIPCDQMYDRYEKAYRELTVIGAYQQHCLRYEEWKVQARYTAVEISMHEREKQMDLLARASENLGAEEDGNEILGYYRRGLSSEALMRCNDGSNWAHLWRVLYPQRLNGEVSGSYPASMLPSNTVIPAGESEAFSLRANALSGRAYKCTAIASVPLPSHHNGKSDISADAFFKAMAKPKHSTTAKRRLR